MLWRPKSDPEMISQGNRDCADAESTVEARGVSVVILEPGGQNGGGWDENRARLHCKFR
jgi:hypothetical protein